jgi:hypothetical protein
LPLPQEIRDQLGLPEDVKIGNKVYKAYPLSSMENLQYLDYYQSSVDLGPDGKPLPVTKLVDSPGQYRSQMWILFCNLRRQVPEMKGDTFDQFLTEPASILGVFSPLIIKSMEMTLGPMKKKK